MVETTVNSCGRGAVPSPEHRSRPRTCRVPFVLMADRFADADVPRVLFDARGAVLPGCLDRRPRVPGRGAGASAEEGAQNDENEEIVRHRAKMMRTRPVCQRQVAAVRSHSPGLTPSEAAPGRGR
jgi:hypothetical protein